MDQATEYVQQNRGVIGSIGMFLIAVIVLYIAYTYLYSSEDSSYTEFLTGEASARKPVPISGTVPTIYTGGDFTLSFWIYIDDWNYRAQKNKFVFALSPSLSSAGTAVSPLVGLLTPYQNGMMIRANTAKAGAVPAPGSAPTSSAGAEPDITVESNLQALMNQQTSMNMFQTTLDKPCDIKEVPLQRWVCVTLVSSGRVLDVYMDGKLSRSCVLDNVIQIPRTKLTLRLGDYGGFGGRYATVQMWAQQLTPDAIYSLYMMGPASRKHDIFRDLKNLLNINVTYTAPATATSPGTAPASHQSQMSQLYAEGSSAEQSLMSRF
jgi:hypothetical protein